VLSQAFSPDGKWLAAGDSQGTITIWDMVVGLKTRPFSFGPFVCRLCADPYFVFALTYGCGWPGLGHARLLPRIVWRSPYAQAANSASVSTTDAGTGTGTGTATGGSGSVQAVKSAFRFQGHPGSIYTLCNTKGLLVSAGGQLL
jgi:WD40 repeat protein